MYTGGGVPVKGLGCSCCFVCGQLSPARRVCPKVPDWETSFGLRVHESLFTFDGYGAIKGP
jgi:hypothetical protein